MAEATCAFSELVTDTPVQQQGLCRGWKSDYPEQRVLALVVLLQHGAWDGPCGKPQPVPPSICRPLVLQRGSLVRHKQLNRLTCV